MSQTIDSIFEITPSDTVDLDPPAWALYVGVTGDVTIDTPAGDTVTLTNLLQGVIHNIQARRVYATGTTATQIMGLLGDFR